MVVYAESSNDDAIKKDQRSLAGDITIFLLDDWMVHFIGTRAIVYRPSTGKWGVAENVLLPSGKPSARYNVSGVPVRNITMGEARLTLAALCRDSFGFYAGFGKMALTLAALCGATLDIFRGQRMVR